MTQPGTPGSQIPPSGVDDTILRVQRDLERRVAAIEASMQGTNGIVVAANSAIKSSPFDGDLVAQTAGTVGWGMDGDTAIFNNIVLRGGIIGNDALTTPLVAQATNVYTPPPGLAYTTSPATVATVALTVPAGFTAATLNVNLVVNGFNPNGVSDNLWSRIIAVGIGNSPSFPSGIPSGLQGSSVNLYQAVATGLTGGQVLTINGQGWTDVAGWPGGVNAAYMSVLGQFTR